VQRAGRTVIVAVDASGSQALHRLGEAKGAVELLLAASYARRDRVALLAFRGAGAELLLPPTRALARAKRLLAGLPGGGGTPLAAGLVAAQQAAESARRAGSVPTIVVLSDGRANLALDGSPGRPAAEADALVVARAIRARGIACAFVDTSPRGEPAARRVAEALGARYVALPAADARAIAGAVRHALDPDA
jgi:magnesium chelatase subunit D